MTFQRPELLLLGPLAALLLSAALTLQWRRLARLAQSYADPALRRLAPLHLQRFPALRMLCLIAACLALSAAAAGPRPAAPEPPQPPDPLDIAVAVDVSRSMASEDLGTSRIQRARTIVDRLSVELPAARIVLILFADWPFTLVPPTDDPTVVRYFAQSLSADLVLDRDQGTSYVNALAHAREALDSRPRQDAGRVVLVLSDGGAHEALDEVLAAAATENGGLSVWTGGLGTRTGAEVPTPTGPLLDDSGTRIVSRLEADVLRDIARVGGGEYHDVSEEAGVTALIDGLATSSRVSESRRNEPLDATFWLILLSIPALLIEGAVDAGRRMTRAHRQDEVA